jgi:phosphoribosylaminoimidazole carboxylase (NCAIR synthetase)
VLARANAAIPPVPSLDVLRRVNHRAFSADLGQCLEGARYARNRDELEATLSASGGPWVLKRAFGFAGRGRQRLRSSELDPSVEPFVRASFDSGEGLEVEPWVDRTLDVALHGFVSQGGSVTLGAPTLQNVDDGGAWISSVRLSPDVLTAAERGTLFREGERAANALVGAGYFGPFCIDAFRWTDARGTSQFNPRSEINARYSMGWAAGMGDVRPDLVLGACAAG